MADITNLTQFLGDIAEAIRTKKETSDSIPAKDFDTEILSIETGTDTSDANATASNIEAGYTAYVNGQKVIGSIVTAADTIITAGQEATITDTGAALNVDRGYGKKLILKSEQQLRSTIPYSTLASIGAITGDKITKGQSVFGVEGTADTGGDVEPAEYFDATTEAIELWGLGDPGFVKYTVTGELIPEPTLINSDTEVTISAPQFAVAEAIGLTADKIKKGETILKIDGTYEGEGSGTITPEEEEEIIAVLDEIIGGEN